MRTLILLCALIPTSAFAAKPYNIVLFAVDGLRADHLGFHGYERHPTSPNLDRWASRAVVFENAEAQSSWTLPSFASLFTSRYPHQHGAMEMNRKLAESELLLTEILRQSGYRTAGFVGGPFLDPEYGFSQGFETYNAGGSRVFSQTLPPALDWLRRNKDEPFFLFVHGNDVHPPFNPSLPEAERRRFDSEYRGPANDILLDYTFVKAYNGYPGKEGSPPDKNYQDAVARVRKDPLALSHISALYDSQIAQVDRAFKKLWDALKTQGLLERTIIVLISDHGLELGERGLLATGYHPVVTETITHVPLVIGQPGTKPRRVRNVVELVDVAPTLLELVGVKPPKAFAGNSLVRLMRGEKEPERIAFGSSTVVGGGGRIPQFFARRGLWKLIYHAKGERFELYDLSSDPGEKRDLAAARPKIAADLSAALLDHIGDSGP